MSRMTSKLWPLIALLAAGCGSIPPRSAPTQSPEPADAAPFEVAAAPVEALAEDGGTRLAGPELPEWSEAVENLRCRVLAPRAPVPRGSAVPLRVELLYDEPTSAAHPTGAPHLLLPTVVDRNHLLRTTVRRNGAELPYRGPLPPGDIGQVDDIVLTPGLVIAREIDLRALFDLEPGIDYAATVRLEAWTYETRVPHYWHETLVCPDVAFWSE